MELQKCNNYWNKELYPKDIVEYGLNNGISEVRETAGRVNILCYHQNVAHPFIIHMASENRIKEHIIHIRPQTDCNDDEKSGYIIIETNVDINKYKCLQSMGQTVVVLLRSKRFIFIYDPNNPKYELLHIAANKHVSCFIDMIHI